MTARGRRIARFEANGATGIFVLRSCGGCDGTHELTGSPVMDESTTTMALADLANFTVLPLRMVIATPLASSRPSNGCRSGPLRDLCVS